MELCGLAEDDMTPVHSLLLSVANVACAIVCIIGLARGGGFGWSVLLAANVGAAIFGFRDWWRVR
jgi:hypothetical protein